MVGAFVLPLVVVGMTDASTTRNPPTPCTRKSASTTQGFGEHADAFERDGIGLDLLPSLTTDDLEKLGVATLAERVRLRNAIAVLRHASAKTSIDAPSRGGSADRTATHTLQRRQVTVMFCDLVGSTALAQTLDPEDLHSLLQAYQQACGAVIERYEGHVAQYLGDGLMVYFGWPTAYEDAAERAVLAALDIREAVAGVSESEPLQVRVGIATGAVVVGDTGYGDASVPMAAIGPTPNLAARVLGQAGPGEIVIAALTHRLAGGTFECEALGERELKGFREPQRCWRVVRAAPVSDRFEAAHGARLTPMIGREPELAYLIEQWTHVRRGEGRVVVLRGEAGVGKSRLVHDLPERLGDESLTPLWYQCSPYHGHSALYPVVKQIEKAALIQRSDPADARLDKLDQLVAPYTADVAEIVPLWAALLSLPLDRYPPLDMSPRRRKEATIDSLTRSILGRARSTPVLMIVEDAHWIDPTTSEALGTVMPAIGDAPVFLVVTMRPDTEVPWKIPGHGVVRSLRRFGRRQTVRLMESVTGGRALPEAIQETIISKSDGIPLFVEELTRNVLASDRLEDSGDGFIVKGDPDAFEVPATLKDSLTARLDQLHDAKRVAQVGAVLGREFPHDLVAALLDLDATASARAFDQLVETGLASRRAEADDAVYTFHHALIQDAAYDSLLKKERRELHRRSGDLLQQLHPEVARREPEVIARHYTLGAVFDKAVHYWYKAGDSAWQRSAPVEALAHLDHGIEHLPDVAEDAPRDALELGLRATMGVVHFAATGYATPQAQAAFFRAHELCGRVRIPDAQVRVLLGVGAFHTMKGDIPAGHDAFEQLTRVAEGSGDPRFLLYTHSMLTWSHYNRGEYRAAIDHADPVAASRTSVRMSR